MSSAKDFTIKQLLLAYIVCWLLKIIKCTQRWQYVGLRDENQQHWTAKDPCILAFWHSQQLFMPWVFNSEAKSPQRKQLTALASEHGDGRLAAALMKAFGITSIPGSSSKGGARAMIAMKKSLEKGNHIAITVDGPRGPVHQVKSGAVKLAAISQTFVRPVALACSSQWTFKSWDKMFIPKPFAKVILIMDEGIKVDPKASSEEIERNRILLEKKITELNTKAKSLLAE